MSFIFGGVRGREDPELAAGNRRTRLHYARDVNDERALADDRPTIRRGRNWTWLAVTVVVLAVLGFAGSRGADEVPVTADCSTPAIAVASSEVTAGQALRFRLTGADDTDYVVTLDGAPVRGAAGSTVAYTETAAGPALQLQQCLSPTLLLAAPAGDGPHQLAMLRLADDGTTTQAAAVTVMVSGTR
jgi:hypothetical protein